MGLAGAVIAAIVVAAMLVFGGGGDADRLAAVGAEPIPAGERTPSGQPAAVAEIEGASAAITEITVSDDLYVVEFETNFGPDAGGSHVHFHFDTVPPQDAGDPSSLPWEDYAGASPFTGYGPAHRHEGAERLCVLVANEDHSVRVETDSCALLDSARITAIEVVAGVYAVSFETIEFEPRVSGQRVHFFFDSVPPDEAGAPGNGPWVDYSGPSPFFGYTVAERFEGAERMCILVANPDQSVHPFSGNCFPLPSSP